MKNKLITVLFAVLMITVLAGCGDSQVSVEAEPAQEVVEEVVVDEESETEVNEDEIEEIATEIEKIDHSVLRLNSIELTEA